MESFDDELGLELELQLGGKLEKCGKLERVYFLTCVDSNTYSRIWASHVVSEGILFVGSFDLAILYALYSVPYSVLYVA